jgi:GntR family transcriptional regulator
MGSTSQIRTFESLRFDRDSTAPMYLRIAEALTALLKSGAYPAGFPLPPERVLGERYGVSRMTLRQAMSILEREGLIESQRGRGTFVAPNRLQKQQQELRSFTEEITARGGKSETRLISFEVITPPPSAREFFGLSKGEKVYEISRLRYKDRTPLAAEAAMIPQKICPWLERFDLAKNSLYRILEESYGLRLQTGTEEISAQLPSAAHRKLLAVPKNTAVLVVDRKTFTDTGVPLESTRSVYRGDLYSAVVHSVRKKKTKF